MENDIIHNPDLFTVRRFMQGYAIGLTLHQNDAKAAASRYYLKHRVSGFGPMTAGEMGGWNEG
ncbi:MAG TPA: hypothetical protein PLX02_00115 [Syntrophorhabdaceae bacterium]|nr:hypothetical protein [Syntrophorhabdaceae bacterium]